MKFEIPSLSLYTILSVAKKLTSSVVTVTGEGVNISTDGVWAHFPLGTVNNCEESVSFAVDFPLNNLKKVKGTICVEWNGAECVFTGQDRNGCSITETTNQKEPDMRPEENDLTRIGSMVVSGFCSLVSMKLVSKFPLYLMFNKKTAVSFLLNEFNAAVVKSQGTFKKMVKLGVNKDKAAVLSAITAIIKPEATFDINEFACWDTNYVKLTSDSGAEIVFEVMKQHIPSFPKLFCPPHSQYAVKAEEIKKLLISKPAVTDQIAINTDGCSFTVMAATLKPIFKVLNDDSTIKMAKNDKFTYFIDENNHLFITGNAKK